MVAKVRYKLPKYFPDAEPESRSRGSKFRIRVWAAKDFVVTASIHTLHGTVTTVKQKIAFTVNLPDGARSFRLYR